MKEGFAGRLAKVFIRSKLSVLLMIAFLLLGAFSIFLIPREEDPQIKAPMADIMVAYPGATPTEVENRVSIPLEKLVSNVKGVEYVYSTSMNGQAMVSVQFFVGQDIERSLVKLYTEIMKHMDQMPQGVSMPLIKTRAIDDVPVLALTLWSNHYGDYSLRQMAEVMTTELKKVPDVAAVTILGGRSKEIMVVLDKDKMTGNHLDMAGISKYIQGSNIQLAPGNILSSDSAFSVQSGSFLKTADDVANLVVGVNEGMPVYLRQIAQVEEGPGTPSQYVSYGEKGDYPAVTIALAKKSGVDAKKLAGQILNQVDHLKKKLIPSDVNVTTTRNYGQTASDKVSELLLHLFVAIVAVTLFVMLAMGWRGGLVIFLSVPVTFALTLFAYYFMDYTLNRITLFALVFVTGIVVDDSIIIAENMHRHFRMKRLPFIQAAIYAINEVGNPTILATFTVIAAVLPMAFVSGMMGPYMSPMPIGASIAMIFSLLVALTLTPYLGYIFLRSKEDKKEDSEMKEKAMEDSKIYKLYRGLMSPMLESRKMRWAFMLSTVVLLLISVSLFFTKSVPVKMLPFDNKNEFQVVIDMPEGTTLERTAVVTKEIAAYVALNKDVVNYQTYVGTSGPINFNGLARHYDLRRGENMADIQINLSDKGDRKLQSHDIAKAVRPGIQSIAKKYNANAKVVEVPPGPPVLSTLVAEIYGPDYKEQINVANQIKDLLNHTSGVVDVDWMVESDQKEYVFDVDKEKAMLRGVAPAQVVAAVQSAIAGETAGMAHQESSSVSVPINLQLSDADKNSINDLRNITVVNQRGESIPVGDLVQISGKVKEKSIYRKNQKQVVYVVGDMAGKLESPVYAMNDVSKHLKEIKLPKGYQLQENYNSQPKFEDEFTLKWDGEWQITYEVFRDLGIAFLIAIIIIYMLIIGWFQNFTVPLIMLTVIPLSLIGIVFGHWIMGAFFSATSMIGFIALAGVMVRNSILLIDFIDIRLKEGVPLKQAILESGTVRSIPILLTAGTVVLGAIVILFDPLFQGLAISLMGGTVTATLLTLVVVPLLYFKLMRNKYK
ncbi:efflux RND transporter permease subunit [uncultured Bacteroides sp.]|uniref:efflux RND transporter permease subunit n=1 Tax=uncultured Bacteroides sp. TaxID=162156 RepID=UPI002AAAED2F|nr:efflux RND transporter permease subunit [uncultured Bacteroides sp.]